MKKIHLALLLSSLMISAGFFKLASVTLGWAAASKRRLAAADNRAINAAFFKQHGIHPDVFLDAPSPDDVDEWERWAKQTKGRPITSPNLWTEAMPEDCPLCGNAKNCKECN